VLAVLNLTFILGSVAHAVSSPVEFIVPDTTLTVSGYASPGALVSIYDGSTIIGTAVAGNNARFSKNFVALAPGLRNIKVDYIDKSGRKSTQITDKISLAFQRETAVEYFLPPTLEISPKTVGQGDVVRFSGSTAPGAQVTVTVDGGNAQLRPQSDPNGNYSISLATDGYFFGDHPVSAKAKVGNTTSYESAKTSFTVVARDNNTADIPGRAENSLAPPIILFPESPLQTDNEQILIRGTAAPNQQIIIYVDGQPIGSAFSNSEGQWFFNLRLTSRNQEIRAITCVNSECSDYSNSLKIEFTGEFGACSNFRPLLDNYRFWGINVNRGIDLTVSQFTGDPPYEIIIEWGDEVSERFNHGDGNEIKINHVYTKSGQFNGNITVKDSRDCIAISYFSVDVQPSEVKLVDLWWAAPAIITVGFATMLRFKKLPQ